MIFAQLKKLTNKEKLLLFLGPIIIFSIMTVGVVQVHFILEKTDKQHLSQLVGFAVDRIENTIEVLMNEKYLALHRMSERLSRGQPLEKWFPDAQSYLRDSKDVDFIAIFNFDLNPIYFVKKDTFLNSDLKKILNNKKEFEKIKKDKPGLLRLEEEGVVLLYVPYSKGFLVEAISEKNIIRYAIEPKVREQYDILIFNNKSDFISMNNAAGSGWSEFNFYRTIKILDQKINLFLSPKKTFLKIHENRTPEIVLILGIFLNATIAFFVVFLYLLKMQQSIFNISNEQKNQIIDGVKKYAVFTMDLLGNITSWNIGAQNLTHYTSEEIIGKNYEIFYQKESRERRIPQQNLKTALEAGKFEELGQRLRKDGTEFKAYVLIGPYYDDKKLSGFIEITHDETERIAKEKQIEELANRFEVATDSAQMGVWDYDIVNNSAIWDDNMYRLYGLKPGLVVKSALETWQSALHPDDFNSATLHMKNAIEGRSKLDTTFRIYWPNGTLKYLRATAKLLRDKNGIPVRMIGVNWDVTQEKELQQLKNEFISIVSHEIRTPLTSIYVSLQLIQDEKTFQMPKELKQLVGIASESCEALTRLINDILDMEKIDSGKMPVNKQLHSVQSLIEHAMEANRAFVEMHCKVPLLLDGKIPVDSYIEIDSDQFQRVMYNLISNAAKFSYLEQPVRVSVARIDRNIRISVINKGDPIPESFRARIFEKFCQADTSNTRKKGGTGLGLNITKSIVEQNGGKINFESFGGPDGKTVFYFDLPEALQ